MDDNTKEVLDNLLLQARYLSTVVILCAVLFMGIQQGSDLSILVPFLTGILGGSLIPYGDIIKKVVS